MNNFRIICIVIFATVHLSFSYNFQDSTFNEALSLDYEEILNSLNDDDAHSVHSRARRDEETASIITEEKCRKRNRKPKLCCLEAVLEAEREKEKEQCKSCFKEVTGIEKPEKGGRGHFKHFDLFSCAQVERRQSEMTCISQCVGQKKGLLRQDGSANPEAILAHLRSFIIAAHQNDWFNQNVDKIVETCVNEAKNATDNPMKFYTEGLKVCNPAGLTLKRCLFNEIQLSCPIDQIKDKAACDKFKEKIQKGRTIISYNNDDVPPPEFQAEGDFSIEE